MAQNGSRSKVARLIEKYDLTELGDELAHRWTRSEDRYGLRRLTEYFNRRLLETALADDDTQPIDGEIENFYRLLTDEEVSSGVRTQARNRLKQNGVDIDTLERDFVSRQAIHTYLTKYRDIETPSNDASSTEMLDRRLESIQRLQERIGSVTERTLDTLTNTNRITLGEFNVLVSVRIHCTDCGTQLQISELFEEGACNCEPPGEES